MPDLKQCEFLVVRYMPDALTEEFVNLGVVLLESGANGSGFSGVRFTRDWRRAKCLDPGLDLELLEELEGDLRGQLARKDRDWVLAKLQDYCSNGIQLTAAKACLTVDPAQELEALARIYLERRRQGQREASGRQIILGKMRGAFEQTGVWNLMLKKIAAADYTHKCDPLKIDCGYQPNGIIRMFHAVSLESDVDNAKVLAFTFPELREGLARKQNAKSELTAIIEPDLDFGDEAIAFARTVMERNEIRVATTADLAGLAEQARLELRV
ncbi:MAG: DUF3037 domain-containing protein [Candidatus Korobacteraceae bacterium]